MTATHANSSPGRALRVSRMVLLALGLAFAILVVSAPIDSMQGVIQKILYVHVPSAFAAYLGFLVTALFGILYLWKGEVRYDQVAHSSAEVERTRQKMIPPPRTKGRDVNTGTGEGRSEEDTAPAATTPSGNGNGKKQ